jgi:hypothetical protein
MIQDICPDRIGFITADYFDLDVLILFKRRSFGDIGV